MNIFLLGQKNISVDSGDKWEILLMEYYRWDWKRKYWESELFLHHVVRMGLYQLYQGNI